MTSRKKRILIAAAVVVLLSAVVVTVLAPQAGGSGEVRDLRRYDRRYARLEFARRHLPTWLAGRLRIVQQQMDISSYKQAKIEALIQSGQLVKVRIGVPGLGGRVRETQERLQRASHATEGYWMALYWTQSNTVVICCEPEQARRLSEAFPDIEQGVSPPESGRQED